MEILMNDESKKVEFTEKDLDAFRSASALLSSSANASDAKESNEELIKELSKESKGSIKEKKQELKKEQESLENKDIKIEPVKILDPVIPIPDPEPKKIFKAGPASIAQADHKRVIWRHTAPIGAKLEDVLQPIYFCNVAKKLTELSKIEVVAEDGSWYAELLIVCVMSASTKLQVLNFIELITVNRQFFENDIHKIEWLGPDGKFTIIRKSDSAKIISGFPNIIEAQKWLIDHEKALLA